MGAWLASRSVPYLGNRLELCVLTAHGTSGSIGSTPYGAHRLGLSLSAKWSDKYMYKYICRGVSGSRIPISRPFFDSPGLTTPFSSRRKNATKR